MPEDTHATFAKLYASVHLPLLLGTPTGRLACVLIALTLALLTMMAEGMMIV